jgi:rubrerythrin
MTLTLEQAIRNAVEAERAADRFYRDLAAATTDEAARALLAQMAAEEGAHADGLLGLARELGAGALPERADMPVRGIESAPAAVEARDLDFEQAVTLALEAENSASLYYDALASSCGGAAAEFFARVAADEERHAARLREISRRGR